MSDEIHCSCGYREFTGIPCSHILFIKVKLELGINIATLICNEAYLSYFDSDNSITNYNINYTFEEFHDEDESELSFLQDAKIGSVKIPKRCAKRRRVEDSPDNVEIDDVHDEEFVSDSMKKTKINIKTFLEFYLQELSTTTFNKIIDIFQLKDDVFDPYTFYSRTDINISKYKYIPICYKGHWSLLYKSSNSIIHFDSNGNHISNEYIYNRLNITNIIPYNVACQKENWTCGYFVIHFIFSLYINNYITVLNDDDVLREISDEIKKRYEDDEDRILSIIQKKYY